MTSRPTPSRRVFTTEPDPVSFFSRPRVLLAAVFAVTLLSYILLINRNYYWDGIFFAHTIESAPRLNASLVHPSHLLDMVFQYVIYRAVLLTGFQPRALTVMQVSNCIFAALAACVFFKICLESFKSIYVSLVSTALFAFAATWWKFSTDANSYILAVLLLLVCFFLALPQRKPSPFTLAMVHVLAMLVHQLSFLFFPVAIAALIFQCRGLTRNDQIKCVAKYVLTVGSVTVAVYFAMFYLATGSLSVRAFATWITYFSPEHGFTFSVWNNLVHTVRSQWRVFLGGRTGFVRDLWGPVILTLVAGSSLVVLAFFALVLRRVAELKAAVTAAIRGRAQFNPLMTLCIIWALVYIVFLFFFIPQNTFYRLFHLPALVILAAIFLTTIQRSPNHVRRYRAALFAAAVFCSNLTLSQYPSSKVVTNPPLQLALKLEQRWPLGMAVYYATPNSDNLLVRYFNPTSVWIQADADVMRREPAKFPEPAHGAWLETTLIEQFELTPEGKVWLDAHTFKRPEFELVNRKYRIRFSQLRTGSFRNPVN
ncbi:MAG TPA: hypothetical protein VFX97_06200 [Pyrinomonadaceae bacterium]|nr:hypothetical protein [Pyrinomonadaceae bacterium]